MPTSTPKIKPSTSLSSLSSAVDKDHVKEADSLTTDDHAPSSQDGVMYRWALDGHKHGGQRKKNTNMFGGPAKKRNNKPVTINISGTRYEVVRYTAIEAGFTISKDDDANAFVIWNDAFVSTDRIFDMKPFQRINHFPGMGEVTRKDCLARNVAKMQKSHSEDFNFTPKTWILPYDYNQLLNYSKDLKVKKKSRTFITKPPNAAQGHGIALYRNIERIPAGEQLIVQEYIDKPLLIEGYKFDLRIYVLITSCDPLRVFLFNDGLVRLSTEKYVPPNESNITNLFMHLTNYSINKHNENYEKGETIESGSKRSFKFFNDYLRKHEYDVVLLWKNISDVIIRTFVMAEPHVLHAYRMSRPGAPPGSDSVCFEILGLDIIVDRKLRPWLLEINRSPSFGTDEEIDHNVKSSLLYDTFKLLNIKISDRRRNIAAEKAEAQKRLLRPTKRSVVDGSDRVELERRRTREKRKDELKDLLEKVKKASAREDYENRNIGRFRRIFPTEDKHRQEKYTNLLLSSFNVFLSGRVGGIEKEIQHLYSNKLREQDIVDLLAECESDEVDGKSGNIELKGLKPLSSMPSARTTSPSHDDYDELTEGFYDCDVVPKHHQIPYRPYSNKRNHQSTFTTLLTKPAETQSLGSSPRNSYTPKSASERSIVRTQDGKVKLKDGLTNNMHLLDPFVQEFDLLTNKTLSSLNEMRIKFPGKTDEEADIILDTLRENWKYHKPRIASYWLVKLDSIKRRKVIDIVRSNVKALVQRIWHLPDVDSLRLYRVFNRVFNRLLWSHGQGLWNCFASPSTSSWEVIFSKSSERLRPNELNCCRRIAHLCQDCLLIVYQFAQEARLMHKNFTSSASDSGLQVSSSAYRYRRDHTTSYTVHQTYSTHRSASDSESGLQVSSSAYRYRRDHTTSYTVHQT